LAGDYKYHTATFLNYCPHCHRYGTLQYTHAEGIFEGRLCCGDGYGNGGCDADYCAVHGKEEIVGTHYWLTKVVVEKKPSPQQNPITSPSKPTMLELVQKKLDERIYGII